MSARPLLLLDVDGVLNACHPDPGSLGEWIDYLQFTANGFTLRYSPEMCRQLRALHDQGRVEIQWLTTWEHDAPKLLAGEMGLPDWEVASIDGEHYGSNGRGWWKWRTAKRLLDAHPDRDLVWIDDDLDYSARVGDVPLGVHLDRVLTITPDDRIGITQAHIDQIDEWLISRAACEPPVPVTVVEPEENR